MKLVFGLICLFVGAVMLAALWQVNPACRSWHGRIDAVAAARLQHQYGWKGPQAHVHGEQKPETYAGVRADVSDIVTRELGDQRPWGCL